MVVLWNMSATNCYARLGHSKQLGLYLKYSSSDVGVIWSANEKLFTVAIPQKNTVLTRSNQEERRRDKVDI